MPLVEDHMPSPLKEVNLDINSKLSEIERYLNRDEDEKSLTKQMTVSDLHTVREDYDEEDDEMNPAAFVHNRQEYAEHVFQAVEYDTVL